LRRRPVVAVPGVTPQMALQLTRALHGGLTKER
jgi:hypothetical protein